MRTISSLLLVASALVLAGCTAVYVTRPIGDQPHALLPADWDGTWVAEDQAAVFCVTDAAAGKLHYAYTEVTNGEFFTKTVHVTVRESGDWLFASIDEGNAPKRYLWLRIKREGEELFAWEPDVKAFRTLVQSGKLKGQLVGEGADKDKNLLLDPLSAEDMKALVTGALGVPFQWDKPHVLRRLKR